MSPEELEQIAETEREEQKKFAHTISVCVAAGCMSCQSQSVKDAIDQEIKKQGKHEACKSKGVGCMGLCAEGPLVSTESGVLYQHVNPSDASDIVSGIEGEPVSRLLCPHRRPLLPAPEKDRARKFRRHRSRTHRRIHRRRRLYGRCIKALTDMTPARSHRAGHSRAACADAAAPAFPPA